MDVAITTISRSTLTPNQMVELGTWTLAKMTLPNANPTDLHKHTNKPNNLRVNKTKRIKIVKALLELNLVKQGWSSTMFKTSSSPSKPTMYTNLFWSQIKQN